MNKLALDLPTAQYAARISHVYSSYIAGVPSPDLMESLQYVLANPGKLLRPMLVYATGAIFDAPIENLDIPATAVELIHTHSLIHDDLPAMDNADLRRGRPTCHKKFNEGIAILAGDGLLTLAFEVLAGYPSSLTPLQRLQMIVALSHAAGIQGMVGGQGLDLAFAKNSAMTVDKMEQMHQLKTGALFSASVEMGRIAGGCESEEAKASLQTFANCIGKAFQIQDDILDVEASTEILGKTAHLDSQNAKITYPDYFGLDACKHQVESLYKEGLDKIAHLGPKAQLLRQIAAAMLGRSY